MTDAETRRKRTESLRKYDADRLEAAITLPEPVPNPALVVMIGLPGSGKSHLAREIAKRYAAAVLDSDALRGVLFPNPEHSEREHARLFPALHLLIDRLLARGVPLIVDATNLKEANRKPYYTIAARYGAKVVLVRAWAPRAVILKRLAGRESDRNPLDRSTATLAVYEKMRPDARRITRRHVSVDTSKDTRAAVDRIVALLQS